MPSLLHTDKDALANIGLQACCAQTRLDDMRPRRSQERKGSRLRDGAPASSGILRLVLWTAQPFECRSGWREQPCHNVVIGPDKSVHSPSSLDSAVSGGGVVAHCGTDGMCTLTAKESRYGSDNPGLSETALSRVCRATFAEPIMVMILGILCICRRQPMPKGETNISKPGPWPFYAAGLRIRKVAVTRPLYCSIDCVSLPRRHHTRNCGSILYQDLLNQSALSARDRRGPEPGSWIDGQHSHACTGQGVGCSIMTATTMRSADKASGHRLRDLLVYHKGAQGTEEQSSRASGAHSAGLL